MNCFTNNPSPRQPACTNLLHRTAAALAVAAGLASFASQHALAAPPEWLRVATTGPTPRIHHAMAYDSIRASTVLFGGIGGGNYDAQTWEWNGTIWSLRAVTGPSARWAHAMAYDSARGVTVLFGGAVGFGAGTSNETWEWNGSTWRLRASTGPSPRERHAMAYDSARGVTVLFGGTNNNVANAETWEWNGTAWTQRFVIGPTRRFEHAMTYDSRRNATVLFGGTSGSISNAEIWEWDGSSWSFPSYNIPSDRTAVALAYDASRGVSVLFGGDDGTYKGDTWEWDGAAWNENAIAGPAPRSLHTLAYDAARGAVVLFGGHVSGGADAGDTWVLTSPTCVPPTVIEETCPQAACAGGRAEFVVSPAGDAPFTYQWYHLDPASAIPGATGNTYTLDAAVTSDAGSYACVVSNRCGSTLSAPCNLVVNPVCPSVMFVRAAATAGGDGTSWANAFSDLQDALDAARTNNSSSQIWVAQGTYRPDRDTRSRDASFELVAGVTLIGGFVGNEYDASQRDSMAHPTILTGDLGAAPQNSYRVVSAQSLMSTAGLVGFTIRSAVAEYNVDRGGGIFASASRVNLTDCVVMENHTYSGLNGGTTLAGVIGVDGSSMELTNCRIVRNTGMTDPYQGPYGPDGGSGWGIICDQSTLNLTNCVIAENRGGSGGGGSCTAGVGWNGGNGGDGGGISLSGGSAAIVTNSTFAGNGPGYGGWGAYCNVHSGSSGTSGTGGAIFVSASSLTLTNCTLASNSSAVVGTLSGSTLRNCIVWNNPLEVGADVRFTSTPQLYPGIGNISGDPQFTDMAGLDRVLGTQDDDLTLAQTSPCIDAGDNTALDAAVQTDLGGKVRFFNAPSTLDTGIPGGFGGLAIVDMGSHEWSTYCPGDYNGDGGADGSDVSAFFRDWEEGAAAADVNVDGGVDGADINTFFSQWEAGC